MLLFVSLVLVFTLQTSLFALADSANVTISVIEGTEYVTFYGTVAFSANDSTENITTQAIEGRALDWQNAILRTYGNAASGIDVNVFIMGGASLDLTYMTSIYTHTVFDAIGDATAEMWWAFKDTLAAYTANPWFVDPVAEERYKVLKFDGQAGNPQTAIIYWFLQVPKKEGAPGRNAYKISDTT